MAYWLEPPRCRDRRGSGPRAFAVHVTLEDILIEVRSLRVELAPEREAKRLAKRRAMKRSSSVLAGTVGHIQPSELHVAKAKRLIRRRLARELR